MFKLYNSCTKRAVFVGLAAGAALLFARRYSAGAATAPTVRLYRVERDARRSSANVRVAAWALDTIRQ